MPEHPVPQNKDSAVSFIPDIQKWINTNRDRLIKVKKTAIVAVKWVGAGTRFDIPQDQMNTTTGQLTRSIQNYTQDLLHTEAPYPFGDSNDAFINKYEQIPIADKTDAQKALEQEKGVLLHRLKPGQDTSMGILVTEKDGVIRFNNPQGNEMTVTPGGIINEEGWSIALESIKQGFYEVIDK